MFGRFAGRQASSPSPSNKRNVSIVASEEAKQRLKRTRFRNLVNDTSACCGRCLKSVCFVDRLERFLQEKPKTFRLVVFVLLVLCYNLSFADTNGGTMGLFGGGVRWPFFKITLITTS